MQYITCTANREIILCILGSCHLITLYICIMVSSLKVSDIIIAVHANILLADAHKNTTIPQHHTLSQHSNTQVYTHPHTHTHIYIHTHSHTPAQAQFLFNSLAYIYPYIHSQRMCDYS